MRRALALIALLPAACGRPDAPATPAPLAICATGFPLADIARQVGGDAVRVDWLLDLGDPLDGVALTPAENARLGNTDFTLADGLRSEPWSRSSLGASAGTGRVLALENLPVAATTPSRGLLWLDPIVVRQFVPTLVDRLVAREPRRRETFEAGGKQFLTALDAVVAEYPNRSFGRGRVVVTSARFDPLLDRFGVRPVLAPADVLDLRDAEIDTIVAAAVRENARALLLPFDTPPGAVAEIEARTKLKAFLIDPLGAPNYPGHGDYLSILRFNLEQLRAATLF